MFASPDALELAQHLRIASLQLPASSVLPNLTGWQIILGRCRAEVLTKHLDDFWRTNLIQRMSRDVTWTKGSNICNTHGKFVSAADAGTIIVQMQINTITYYIYIICMLLLQYVKKCQARLHNTGIYYEHCKFVQSCAVVHLEPVI